MRHPSIESWVDFVRGVGTEADRVRLREHESGCASCRRTVRLLAHMAAIGDADVGVPDEVLAAAVGLFATHSRMLGPSLTEVRLVYDSRTRQAASGRKETLPRRLLFGAPEAIVDINMNEVAEDGCLSVDGLITSPESGQPAQAAVSALRQSKGPPIACAHTDEFGSFVLRYAPPPEVLLQIAFSQPHRSIELRIA